MAGIKHFPSLDRAEFSTACHHLDRRYRQATLGPLRRQWRLRLCAALDHVFSIDGSYTTYVQITRPLEPMADCRDLSDAMGRVSFEDHDGADADMIGAEESDSAVIVKDSPRGDVAHVVYEIHLHPTYRIPCLWFTLHHLQGDEAAFDIDTVFRRLVPDEYKSRLRGQGAIGGISADHHPITGVPAFFIHPCLLGDAISGFQCSLENYLIIWLGLVGGCIGLWVPTEMALQ
ncbi:autophagy-like protein 3 [Ophiocordyceps camponoti-floridani]|uniref:Ubiquitin-like-conjugating enzyme ATG10 n=1 Tax=Ophiocordyceps camponoti-floridani TaxID=2030778 RepID=A0A8H4Q0Z8_9HYPO|nr:autophagy-like protein 3 [Ophiocordyceps camponoti-floridani]